MLDTRVRHHHLHPIRLVQTRTQRSMMIVVVLSMSKRVVPDELELVRSIHLRVSLCMVLGIVPMFFSVRDGEIKRGRDHTKIKIKKSRTGRWSHDFGNGVNTISNLIFVWLRNVAVEQTRSNLNPPLMLLTTSVTRDPKGLFLLLSVFSSCFESRLLKEP